MDEIANPISAPEVQENIPIFNRILKIIAYPVAAASGLWVASREVHNSAYKRAKSVKGNALFKDVCNVYDPQYLKNSRDIASGIISREEYLANELRIKDLHSKAVGEQLEKLGLGNKFFGLKDLPAKWKYINRGNRQQAIINGLTVSGIAIGAILTMANSKALTNLFSKHSKEEEQER